MKPEWFLGVPVDPVTNESMAGRISKMLNSSEMHSLMTPNPEMVMLAQKDQRLKEALQNADLVIPDGIGLILVSRLKGKGLRERVTGIDTMETVMNLCRDTGRSIFLLGGKPGRAEKAKEQILARFTGIRVAGCEHGYFTDEEEARVLEKINHSGADVLFVCLGSPKQEIFIHRNRHKLQCSLAMGAGGSVDVYAGAVRRAPVWIQRMGMEWLYRLWQEPARGKRILILPWFVWRMIRSD